MLAQIALSTIMLTGTVSAPNDDRAACAVAYPRTNSVAWDSTSGHSHHATYHDMGTHLVFDRPVPRFVRITATRGAGPEPRFRCFTN